MDNQELLSQVVSVIKEQTETMTDYIDQRVHEIKLMIENGVSKRIEVLFDGYQLTHEKQWELERRTNAMEQQIEDLQSRIAALEYKTA